MTEPADAAVGRCAGCGLQIAGATDGCQWLFELESARHYSDWRFARHHRLCVDAYALQHPDRYCRSATSFAAHLTGLCAAFDHPGHPTLLRDLQQWLSRRPPLERPHEPAFRGTLTIADIHAVADPTEYGQAVERWARSTWDAYDPLHGVAREWVARVLR